MQKEELINLIKIKMIEVIPGFEDTPIDISQGFKELGTNSLERMEIMMGIMEELSLDIPRIELSNVQSIISLAELLERKLKEVVKL